MLLSVKRSADHPTTSAKNVTGDFGQFTEFMKRLMRVPHSEIKEVLDAEKREKAANPRPRGRPASRASSGQD